ncbi:MAG: bifunctional homocysteine S-methyltransferase/methylenetetrahydrofolate reductase [Chloroflexi bacterium]|nr:bifunctional homocysteine S-methyltransferase/methylenetetrahydrofolate reductase [Chloroflexota bacterium]
MKLPFLQRLQQGEPLLGDGAMGTLLHSRGVPMDVCFDELNITRPEIVLGIHKDYIAAGADLIETNTFSANRYKLMQHGLQDTVATINRAGVDLVKLAIAQSGHADVYIGGSVGPLGVRLKPYGRLTKEDARAAYKEQIGALAEAGVDVLLLETFTDHVEMLEALAAARAVASGVPVICHMTFGADDRTLLGYLPGRVARDLYEAGADVIGVNCSGGPEQLSRILQAMHHAVPQALCSVMPNAGFPQAVGGRVMYSATEDYFADYALTFKAIGARLIGGCCGTTPEHIAAMRQALNDKTRTLPHLQTQEMPVLEDALTAERPTELANKLAHGHFVITVEMAPPRAYTIHKTLNSARMLQEAGADCVDIADSPTARMRMSPWAVCHVLSTQLQIETVLHFPTRGRNLLRIQGDLLAAHALGLRNLFVTMGDPTAIGDYPEAHDTYDIAPSALIALIKQRMNAGLDQAGNSIGQPTSFTVGCALNMGAEDVDKEIKVLVKKLEAGADFALGQPVFEPEKIERFHQRYQEVRGEALKLPVLMGVLPLYSLRHAQFLHNEIPGLSLPAHILKRIEEASDSAPQEGVKIAQELLRAMRGMVQGAYIIPQFGRYDLAAEIIDALPSRSSVTARG